jgi:hypothetical protein
MASEVSFLPLPSTHVLHKCHQLVYFLSPLELLSPAHVAVPIWWH